MKTEDGTLRSYLIKTLQPLTEADPRLVADYVAALLSNNKPKKELQKLCTDSLFDFLGDGTKQFVTSLFQALDEGTILIPDSSKNQEPGASAGDSLEVKASPNPPAKPGASRNSDAEESSDDEDDDRNHKHRRPRSRSFDKDVEDDERGHRRKRSRSIENGQYYRESYNRNRYRSREHSFASRIVADGAVRGGILRTGSHSYRGDSGTRYYHQRGRGNRGMGWLPPEQRFGGFTDGPEFPSVLLSQGPTAPNLFVNRVPGAPSIPGSLDHVIPLTGGHGFTVNPLVVSLPRPRCMDFEEQGYCLRGDLCPMDHGANRIVVDDVQSLNKLTLPIANTRNGASGTSAPSAGGRPNREGDETNLGSEYDPDQPLWGKDNAQGQQAYQQKWENSADLKNATLDETKLNEAKGLESGVSVWDRIGPVESPRAPGAGGKKEQGSGEKPGTDENVSGNGHGGERPHVPRSAEGTSYGGRDRGEKAQRTLYVRCIPSESNKSELLRAHFQKFGEVVDVRVPPHSDRAFVQFSRKEDAEAAVVSPEAVFGNRFIRVSWANRDNRAGPGHKSNGAKPTSNGNPPETTGQASASVSAAVAAQNQKKQEELEQLKEEIRKKQEALAQKRDEFKRRLDKLAKQDNKEAPSVEDDSSKSNAADAARQAARTSKLPTPRAANAAQAWGPARYKLDNRTTAFKFSTPPPADVAALKAHFGAFGEVSSLEAVEDTADGVQVTFATRRDAEKAFTHGRMWQGQILEPAWVVINHNTSVSRAAAGNAVDASPAPTAAESLEKAEQVQAQISPQPAAVAPAAAPAAAAPGS